MDNSLQSFQANLEKLRDLEGPDAKLRVEIEFDRDLHRITISDNAGGISESDFPRAFRPAELPDDRSGLSEFGMGMKSASCWFAPEWSVRTTALGDPVERVITFNIDRIVSDQLNELGVDSSQTNPDHHYTVIELRETRRLLTGRTLGKIRDHLEDIYREFFRRDELILIVNGKKLVYEEPSILEAPVYKNEKPTSKDSLLWRKDIGFDLGGGQRVFGFAALLASNQKANRLAGFSLFRRKRVIQGSGEDKYKPYEIFGAEGTYISRRLFGELHLEEFDVSHTKDGFRWDEDDEDSFLELLKEHLDSSEMPLLTQARQFRVPPKEGLEDPEIFKKLLEEAAEDFAAAAPSVAEQDPEESSQKDDTPTELEDVQSLGDRMFTFNSDGKDWQVKIELSPEPDNQNLFNLAHREDESNVLHVRIFADNPFVRKYVRLDVESEVNLLMRFCAGFALSEHIVRVNRSGNIAGRIRKNFNKLLSKLRT